MWEAAAQKTRALGGTVLMGHCVEGLDCDADRKRWTVTCRDAEGRIRRLSAAHVISSAPLRPLVAGLTPPVSAEAHCAAERLRYRDFLVVALILRDRGGFPDNWVYVHDPSVKVGRIQNFKSWSPDMIPDPALCCYGLEYFCFEGDGLWEKPDADLLALAKAELAALGLAASEDVQDGCVVRQRKAYPIYDTDYAAQVETIRQELEGRFPNLHLVGRNGMHKYNNQDHAMMTAMLTVKNILAGTRVYDIWQVNQDAEYHEEHAVPASLWAGDEKRLVESLRAVPSSLKP